MDMIECKGKTVDEAVFSGLIKMDLSIDEVKIEVLDTGGSLFKSAKVRLTKKTEDDTKETVTVQQEERQRSEERSFSPREHRDRRDNAPRYDKRHDGPRRDKRDEYRRENHGVSEESEADADFTPQEPANDAEKFLLGLFDKMGNRVRLKSSSEEGILKVDLSGRGMGMLIGRRGETLDALQYLTSLVVNNGKEDYTKVMLDTEDYRKKREDTLRRLAARLADRVQKSGKRVVLEPMNPYERRILHSTLQDFDKVYTYSEGEDPFRSVVVALKGSEDEPQAAPNANK